MPPEAKLVDPRGSSIPSRLLESLQNLAPVHSSRISPFLDHSTGTSRGAGKLPVAVQKFQMLFTRALGVSARGTGSVTAHPIALQKPCPTDGGQCHGSFAFLSSRCVATSRDEGRDHSSYRSWKRIALSYRAISLRRRRYRHLGSVSFPFRSRRG